MNKKLIIGIILLVIIIVGGIFTYSKSSKTSQIKTSNESIINSNSKDNESNIKQNSKILIVYFSAQSHTKAVAEKISENLNANLFEITPKEAYTTDDLDYTDDNSRVSREHDDETLRNVELTTTNVENWEDYDVVLIGYPIWWGMAAWPVNTFVKANDFTNKTIIPFCTSASSGLGNSATTLANIAGTGNWTTGQRFNSNPSDSEIKEWTDSLIKE